jgi:hypothetical protein
MMQRRKCRKEEAMMMMTLEASITAEIEAANTVMATLALPLQTFGQQRRGQKGETRH